MMKTILVLFSVAALAAAHDGHDHPHNDAPTYKAVVRLDGSTVHGNVTFTQLEDGKVHVTGTIVGMPPGEYGFHIHERGDLTGGCASAGPHFNPHGKQHGHPNDENRHVGDLGNVQFNEDKVSNIDFVDRLITLYGTTGIIGRALVLHERADDFGKTDHVDSRVTGNAGGRVICGVIGIAEPAYGWPRNATSALVPTLAVPVFTLLVMLFVILWLY